MRVLTDQIMLFIDLELAKTDRPVIILQAPETIIHGTGMIYDKNAQTFKLLHKVKAHYERPNK